MDRTLEEMPMINDDTRRRFLDELTILAALDGVSGHEQQVVEYLRGAMEPLVDRVEIDALGNLYATRGGHGPHLMVEAHSDEIGALVAAIEPDGFLRFEVVGGVGAALMIGRKVSVAGRRGVVGVRPGHLLTPEEARSVPQVRDLYIDLGMESREEMEALGIKVGDQITWRSEVESTANPNRVVGKGIDNRTGCLIVLELLRSLQGQDLPGTLTVVVAVQEEVGLKGARMAAQRVRPDCALVVDTTPCPDTPDSRNAHTFPVRLGQGPVIQVSSGPHVSGFIMSEPVRDFVLRVTEDADIPCQPAAFSFGNTDAGSIYDSAEGIPTAVATMPRRYSHSPVEMLDLNDAFATLHLCQEVVRRMREFPLGLMGEVWPS
jgi:putative aminopeptidase FrvX